MKVTVRMDDITPDMDWKSFAAFEKLFEKYGIRPLLGIVPDNRDEKLSVDPAKNEFWDKMRQLQKKGWCLAMHGCHHVYSTKKCGCFPLNGRSEFAGLSEKEQRALLTEGKKQLAAHGIHTDIFMAPGHTFDKTTLRILKELRFSYVTDGFGKMPYLYEGMTFLPISFLRSRMFSKKEGFTTLVIHCNHSSEEERKRYEEMFAAQKDSFVPYQAFLRAPAKRQGKLCRVLEYLMATGKRLAGKFR